MTTEICHTCSAVLPRIKRVVKKLLTTDHAVLFTNKDTPSCGGKVFGYYKDNLYNDLTEEYLTKGRLYIDTDALPYEWSIHRKKVYAVPILAYYCCPEPRFNTCNFLARHYGVHFAGDVLMFKTKKDAKNFVEAYKTPKSTENTEKS